MSDERKQTGFGLPPIRSEAASVPYDSDNPEPTAPQVAQRKPIISLEHRAIGDIGNYYGGLSIKAEDDKFYWSIENYDGDYWEEIPEHLYRTILEFHETQS